MYLQEDYNGSQRVDFSSGGVQRPCPDRSQNSNGIFWRLLVALVVPLSNVKQSQVATNSDDPSQSLASSSRGT